jgi:tRNA nucleotidyltransferase/poly(A) polymerase
MADYVYLLENRLSESQRNALGKVREVCRAKGLTLFLTGGAVRDLTSGTVVRDLDFSTQGNPLKLKKDLEKAGAKVEGEHTATETVYLRFAGAARVELTATRSETYPKPGKPVYAAATILEDLRRRDFTVNAMAISLNEGSYGLVLDPLNGMADLEARQLSLVSNYGFIEDPVRMIRATRLSARLGWPLEARTAQRYENAKAEDCMDALSSHARGYELEEILHEEDPLRILRALEHEGWMKHLMQAWSASKVNWRGLEDLHEKLGRLDEQGIHADASAAHFELMTEKLGPKTVNMLKKSFVRHGLLDDVKRLESTSKELTKRLLGKDGATASGIWKLLQSAEPSAVLWLAHTGKTTAIQNRFKSFFTARGEAKAKLPHLMMHEMRIVPTLAIYDDLIERMTLELMDGKLTTPEAQKAWLEPHSPPPPPTPVSVRRPRPAKKAEKVKKVKPAAAAAAPAVAGQVAAPAQKGKAAPAAAKAAVAPITKAAPVAKAAPTSKAAPAAKAPAAAKVAAKAVPAKAVAKKPAPKKVVAKKPAPKKAAKPVKKPVAKKKPAAKKKPVKKAAKKKR